MSKQSKNRNKNATVKAAQPQLRPLAQAVQSIAPLQAPVREHDAMPDAPRLTKDQQRAACAYGQVGQVARLESKTQDNYKTAVRALGANILRSGLSAALADLQRRKDRAKALREHLAEANVPGLAGAGEADLFQRVNALDVGQYMLATREMLQVAMWLKRACDAILDDSTP